MSVQNNKYFELKTCWAATPTQITYLLLQLQVRTQQHVRTMQSYMLIHKSMSNQSCTQAWAHRHRQTVAYIMFSLNLFSFGVVLNNLASHAHVILTRYIVFLCFQT